MASPANAATRKPGGGMGFLIGCLFGFRTGTEWNEGKDIAWPEWVTLIPGATIWSGIECAKGMTAHDFAKKYRTNWY